MAEYIDRAKLMAHIEIEDFPDADVVSMSEFLECKNELCLRCGSYAQAHIGACDGCKWKG